MPLFNSHDNNNDLQDLRSTIYWNPIVRTDINGKAGYKFFNAEGPGTYKVTVEGIDAEGRLGRKIYKFLVEAK